MADDIESEISGFLFHIHDELHDIVNLIQDADFFYWYRSYADEFPTANQMSFFEGAFMNYLINKFIEEWKKWSEMPIEHKVISAITQEIVSRKEEIYELYRKKIGSKNV